MVLVLQADQVLWALMQPRRHERRVLLELLATTTTCSTIMTWSISTAPIHTTRGPYISYSLNQTSFSFPYSNFIIIFISDFRSCEDSASRNLNISPSNENVMFREKKDFSGHCYNDRSPVETTTELWRLIPVYLSTKTYLHGCVHQKEFVHWIESKSRRR